MKILLMGNSNVGKSVIFSRLTGIEVVSANYPGTTVEYTEGRMKLGEKMATLVDAPGVYSLDPTSNVEEVTRQIFAQGADVIVNVIDSTNLERNLNLTLQILEWGLPTVIALNLWDVVTNKGIEIDTSATISRMAKSYFYCGPAILSLVLAVDAETRGINMKEVDAKDGCCMHFIASLEIYTFYVPRIPVR